MLVSFFIVVVFAKPVLNLNKVIVACFVHMGMFHAHLFKKEISVMSNVKKPRKWGVLVLFASFSTLICCAMPILLVSLGMGAVVASLASNVPFLITLSQYKLLTFSVTGLLLLFAGWALYRKGRVCPSDPELGALCESADKWNKRFLMASVFVWGVGVFAAFLLPLF